MLEFNGAPFSVGDVRTLDCQFGEKYYKQKKPLGKRLWLQGTRKLGCAAHIQIKSFVLYPDYAVISSENVSKWKLQCLRQEKLSKLREDIHAKSPVKTIIKHFVSLPSEAAHSGHPTGQSSNAVFSQKLHPKVTSKITEIVHSGITETAEVKRLLKYYVDSILCKELGQKPALYDRSFYPLNSDIRNHVYMAKKALDLLN